MSTDHALTLLDTACQRSDAHLVAANLDVTGQPADELPPILRALAADRPATAGRGGRGADQKAPPRVDWVGRLAGLTTEDQLAVLLDLVRTHAASVLGHEDPVSVRADTPFKDLGFDSLTGVELRNRLSAVTGLDLPAALVFRHPSPSAIAAHLRDRLAPADADESRPIFVELERLEAVLERHGPEGTARTRLAKRLESLLWKLDGQGEVAGAVDDNTLESASDDEMFELIDRELGSQTGGED
nr:phosphopantetheine-binding protein [Micromonospora sp. DSM 115978]